MENGVSRSRLDQAERKLTYSGGRKDRGGGG